MSSKDSPQAARSPKDSIKDAAKESRKSISTPPPLESSSTPPPDAKQKAKEAEKRRKGAPSPTVVSTVAISPFQGSGQVRPLPSHHGINFESFEEQFSEALKSKEAIQALLTFPSDDVIVEELKRKMRTSKPPSPGNFSQHKGSYIPSLNTLFAKQWRVVTHPHIASGLNSEMKDDFESLPDIAYDVDKTIVEPADNSENKIEKTAELQEYVSEKKDAEAVRKETRTELSKDRQTLFLTFSMEMVQDAIDPRPQGKPFSDELVGTQILIEVNELSFEWGYNEPFFGSMALYDIKKKEKLSETWNFDLNPPAITELLGPHCGERDAATLAKSCIFTTSCINSDIYLLITFSTILHGKDDFLAPYLTPKMKDKEKEKHIQEAKMSTLRLGGYRQVFGYNAFQLFDENQSLKITKDMVLTSLFRPKVERDAYNWIEKTIEKGNRSTIPVKFSFSAKKVNDKDGIRGRLAASLLPVKPLAKGPDSKTIREMGDLSSIPDASIRPNISYENTLYFMPESLNFSHASGSSRNIAIEVRLMESDNDINSQGLPVIYGTSVSSSLTNVARSHVWYHSERPIFSDEVKIQLPTFLTSGHHLLISFYHLTCQLQKGKPNQAVETLVGRTFIPIYPNNQVKFDGRDTAPVALNLPNENYLSEHPDNPPVPNAPNPVKWIDNGKPIFAYRMKTVSTVYPQDSALDEFFKKYEAHKTEEHDDALVAAIQGLENADKSTVLEYFPSVLNLLFHIMATAGINTQEKAFLAVINIVQTVHSKSNNDDLLESYVQYIFENQSKTTTPLCEVLVDIWLFKILESKNPSDNVIVYAWFMFKVLYKSIVLNLEDSSKLKASNRKGNFPHSFTPLLNKLLTQLAMKTKELCSSTFAPEGRKLYQHVALFLRNLFSVMDRGAVFEMIYRYVFELDPDQEATPVILESKFQFLKIICDHENYIQLNIPIYEDLSKIAITDIKTAFWRRHFLAGLLLDEVSKCLIKESPDKRVAAVTTLRDLLWKHDHDPRYAEPKVKERVAQIYFPFILTVIDSWHFMRDARDSYSPFERRSWLVSFLWVLKNVNRATLQNWWKRDATPKRKKAFLDVLYECLGLFEYPGLHNLQKKDIVDQTRNGMTPSIQEAVTAQEKDDPKRRKHAKARKAGYSFGSLAGASSLVQDAKSAIASYYPNKHNGSDASSEGTASILNLAAIVKKEQNLGMETSLVILDIMSDFISDHKNDLIKRENVEVDKFEADKLFEKTFDILIRMLQCNQSKSVFVCIFNQLQWIIPKFRVPLFKFRSSVCGALTYEIVRHANSKWAVIRSLACGVILLMIKQNYEEVKNFSRMKLQSTVAISQLFAANDLGAQGADPLKDALSAIRSHALNRFNKEKTKHGTLGSEVKELIARLEHVIEDNLKMEQYSFDPETKADLYHQISRGYLDSPDLRNTELEKLALMHIRDSNFEECAMVRISQAILVGEYLRMLNRMGTDAMPTNFTQMFPNLEPEILLPKKQELETLEAEICQSRVFTEDGFVQLLAQAVAKLKEQALFETSVEVYRLLLPIYQFKRDYQKQAECYEDLHKLCISSVEQMQTNNRIFAQYYRVAFFGGGDKLQELDGRQYIYKENGAVRLDGITERLAEQFSAKIAKENIHFASNINFERSSMQIGHLYIQLMSVEPYFTAEELEGKPTLFQQNFNVNTFIYETPYFKSKEKDKLGEQWKKKTILTVEGAFPCLKKRLPIRNVQVLELSPIETATEAMIKKGQAVQSELSKTPVNTKTLQRELQGTLLLQVNAGPAAVAIEFLEGPNAASYSAEHKQKLGDAFITLVKLLAEGVSANNMHITVDQLTLQSELKNGYFRLKALVCRLTNTPEEEIEQNFSPDVPPDTSDSASSAGYTSSPVLSSQSSDKL